MTKQRDKPRRLKTIRGEIRFSREHLYLPELKTGVSPPLDRRLGIPARSMTPRAERLLLEHVARDDCGLIGERVKHARMRWTRRVADAIHAIKAAIMSEDGRWQKRWPPPVPILETPAFATAA